MWMNVQLREMENLVRDASFGDILVFLCECPRRTTSYAS